MYIDLFMQMMQIFTSHSNSPIPFFVLVHISNWILIQKTQSCFFLRQLQVISILNQILTHNNRCKQTHFSLPNFTLAGHFSLAMTTTRTIGRLELHFGLLEASIRIREVRPARCRARDPTSGLNILESSFLCVFESVFSYWFLRNCLLHNAFRWQEVAPLVK